MLNICWMLMIVTKNCWNICCRSFCLVTEIEGAPNTRIINYLIAINAGSQNISPNECIAIIEN